MANSIHYNGVDLSGSSYGVIVPKGALPVMGPPVVYTHGAAQGYAGAGRFGGYQPLYRGFEVILQGTSRSNFLTRLDNLVAVLNPANGAKSLRFDQIPDRYWVALLDQPVQHVEQLGLAAARFALDFVAPDPRAYSTTSRTSPDFTITTNPQTMTVEAGPTVVAGTAPADPVWTLKNTSGATVTSWTLNNTTTSESVTWSGSLANGSWMKIDVPRGVIEVSTDSGGTWTSAMTGVSGAFVLPTLKAGVANSVVLTGFSGATVVLEYTARYL